MEQDIITQIDEKIYEITRQNLNEKKVEYIQEIENCKQCMYYEKAWLWGSRLHCCCNQADNPTTSRKIEDLYEKCPINHQTKRTKTYIKRYGIRHYKPSQYDSGCFMIGDFKDTTFESDGHNPDVDFQLIAEFYYWNEEDKKRAEEMAYYYYNKFNLDAEYVEKICYG